MANQMTFALAFALAVSAAHADNCAQASSIYELKDAVASSLTWSCTTNSMTCTRTGTWPDIETDCDCGEQCCEPKSNTCYSLAAGNSDGSITGTSVCGTDRTHKQSESSWSTASTAATYDADCCVAKPLCSSMSSCTTAGMKKDATKDAIKCMMESCSDNECCMIDPDKCLGVMAAGNTCGADRETDSTKNGNSATAATYDANCCKQATCATLMFTNTCVGTRMFDTNAATTPSTAANYDANCCKAMPTPAQCGSITCTATAGYMDDPAKTATTNCVTAPCTVGECCLPDPAKCLGFRMTNSIAMAKDCDTSNPPTTAPGSFTDANKNGAAVADVDAYAAACCTARTSCDAFASHSYGGDASGAEQMYKPAASLLVLVTGAVLAFTH